MRLEKAEVLIFIWVCVKKGERRKLRGGEVMRVKGLFVYGTVLQDEEQDER